MEDKSVEEWRASYARDAAKDRTATALDALSRVSGILDQIAFKTQISMNCPIAILEEISDYIAELSAR